MEHEQERNPLKYAPGIRIKYGISMLMCPCITLEYCLLTVLCRAVCQRIIHINQLIINY